MELTKNILVAALAAGLVACGGGGSSSSSGDAGNSNDSNNGGSTPDTGDGGTGERKQAPEAITEENYTDFIYPLWRSIEAGTFANVHGFSSTLLYDDGTTTSSCAEAGSVTSVAETLEQQTDPDETFPIYAKRKFTNTAENCEGIWGTESNYSLTFYNYYWNKQDGFRGNDEITEEPMNLFEVQRTGTQRDTETGASWTISNNYYYVRFEDIDAINPGYWLQEKSESKYGEYMSIPVVDNPLYTSLTSAFSSSSEAQALSGKPCAETRNYRLEKCSVIYNRLGFLPSYINKPETRDDSTLALGRYVHLYDGVESKFRADFETTEALVTLDMEGQDFSPLQSGQLTMRYDTGEVIQVTVTGEFGEDDREYLVVSLDKDGDGVNEAEKRVYDGAFW